MTIPDDQTLMAKGAAMAHGYTMTGRYTSNAAKARHPDDRDGGQRQQAPGTRHRSTIAGRYFSNEVGARSDVLAHQPMSVAHDVMSQ